MDRVSHTLTIGMQKTLVTQVCITRERMLSGEQSLRQRAKLASDLQVSATLANNALTIQRRRHQHEIICAACRAMRRPHK